MNIYKVPQLGLILVSVPLRLIFRPQLLSQLSAQHSDLQAVPVHKRICFVSLSFSFDIFLWNGNSSLEWIC